MTRPGFTVVTPNFNGERYLAMTIESVLENLQSHDEFFVIDGGSTDGSVAIIEEYAKRITGWISEPDRGYADAIRKGFSQGRASLMCWINSSDVLLKGSLDLAAELIDSTASDLIFGDDLYFGEDGRVIQRTNGEVRSLRNMMLFAGWTPLQDACFWRRTLYDRVGGIDAELSAAADFDLFLRCSLAGRCTYVPNIFSGFRQHPGQKNIADARLYHEERQLSRSKALESNAVGLRRWLTPYYWTALRARHRFAIAKVTTLVGKPVLDISAGS